MLLSFSSYPSPVRTEKKSTFQLPPDLGRGLTPADSLRAVLNYLKGRREYQAETLRFHYMYEYIRTLARQKPDTLPALTQELRSWAQKSKRMRARRAQRGGFMEQSYKPHPLAPPRKRGRAMLQLS